MGARGRLAAGQVLRRCFRSCSDLIMYCICSCKQSPESRRQSWGDKRERVRQVVGKSHHGTSVGKASKGRSLEISEPELWQSGSNNNKS